MSTVFDAIVATVPVKAAAERYGLRPNRAGMARYPFHDDHTPSLKLNEDYFYCFGCGAKGDVVDLVAKLFDLKPFDAACKLAADFVVDVELTDTVPQNSRSDLLRCQRILNEYLDLLYRWKVRYRPTCENQIPADRYVEACQMLATVEYMASLLASGEPEQQRRLAEKLMADGKMDQLEERTGRLILEESPA